MSSNLISMTSNQQVVGSIPIASWQHVSNLHAVLLIEIANAYKKNGCV